MKNYRYVGSGKELEFDELKSSFSKRKEISVILPAYNEEGNIKRLCEEITSIMSKTKYKNDYEIVIVDDNSKDKTSELIDALAKKLPVIALHRYSKRGIFSAIQDGIKIANGKYILNMDSDFNHPPRYILDLLKYKEDYDLVLCSRFVKGGGMPSTLVSKIGAWGINTIISFLLGLKVKDINGGFHIMKKSDFEKIDFKYQTKFGEFDMELLFKAKKLGLKMREVPFVYQLRNSGESQMGNKLQMSYYYFKRAMQLKFEK